MLTQIERIHRTSLKIDNEGTVEQLDVIKKMRRENSNACTTALEIMKPRQGRECLLMRMTMLSASVRNLV